jgi:hypothetical protein
LTTPFFSKRLEPGARAELLGGILDRVRAARRPHGPAPVAIFDLDGTLMDNRPRVVAIIRELGATWERVHPEAAAACGRANPDDIVYGFIDNLKHLGIVDPALHEEGLEFWKGRFFTDAHQRYDIEVIGAREYVHAVHDAGAIVVYLTGRDLPGMALGSFASLRDLGFPIGVLGAELVVKPTFEMPDAAFKREVAPSIARLGELVAVFDNEPANVNLFLETHPTATGVFLDTQYAPNPIPLDPRVVVIENFVRQT